MEKNIKIAIIDDSLSYREYLKSIFKKYNLNSKYNYEIYEFKDPVYFLEQLYEIKPDVIISDIAMKYLDGFSMINILKNILNLKIPIILITGEWDTKYGLYLAKKMGQLYIFSKKVDEHYIINVLNNINYKKSKLDLGYSRNIKLFNILTKYIKFLESNLIKRQYLEELRHLNNYILKKDFYIQKLFDIIYTFVFINNIHIIVKEGKKIFLYTYKFSSANYKCFKKLNDILNKNKRNISITMLRVLDYSNLYTDIKITRNNIKNYILKFFHYKIVLKKNISFRIYLEYIPDIHTVFFLETLKIFLQSSILNFLYSLYIVHESRIDHLTALYNRTYLYEFLYELEERYKENHEIYSLILFDIDFFKKINDNFGHLAGDFVLKEIAGLVKQSLRPFDEVFRFGGEEILVVLPSTSLNEAKLIVNRLLNLIRHKEFIYFGHKIKITLSAGVCDRTIVKENEKYLDIIKYADHYLYKAKENGRDQYQTPE